MNNMKYLIAICLLLTILDVTHQFESKKIIKAPINRKIPLTKRSSVVSLNQELKNTLKANSEMQFDPIWTKISNEFKPFKPLFIPHVEPSVNARIDKGVGPLKDTTLFTPNFGPFPLSANGQSSNLDQLSKPTARSSNGDNTYFGDEKLNQHQQQQQQQQHYFDQQQQLEHLQHRRHLEEQHQLSKRGAYGLGGFGHSFSDYELTGYGHSGFGHSGLDIDYSGISGHGSSGTGFGHGSTSGFGHGSGSGFGGSGHGVFRTIVRHVGVPVPVHVQHKVAVPVKVPVPVGVPVPVHHVLPVPVVKHVTHKWW